MTTEEEDIVEEQMELINHFVNQAGNRRGLSITPLIVDATYMEEMANEITNQPPKRRLTSSIHPLKRRSAGQPQQSIWSPPCLEKISPMWPAIDDIFAFYIMPAKCSI